LNSKVSFKVSFSLQLHDYGREKKMRREQTGGERRDGGGREAMGKGLP
jgi:hypothetical protein